ncbi:MAG: hypothetical protein NTX92_06685 [Euryarchaeota archaeon]|jgi:hypothetical protein|nr:hypothetical protein [Euryarchaeota archaeon]
MTSKTNKIISAVVAITIIIAIAVLIYVNLPKPTEKTNDNTDDHKTIPPTLTLIYDDEQKNFTFGEIERLESYTAKGGYRNSIGVIKGVGNYTGVNITTLVNTLQPVPYRYTLQVFSEDGKNMSYNYSTIIGQVPIYNPENGSAIGTGNMTLVLAYQFEGDWLNESSDGKLRIVFLDNQGFITESKYWMKMVTSIRVITE